LFLALRDQAVEGDFMLAGNGASGRRILVKTGQERADAVGDVVVALLRDQSPRRKKNP